MIVVKVLAGREGHRDYCLPEFGYLYIYPFNGDSNQQALRGWGDALVRQLLSFPEVRSVRIFPSRISISKSVTASWDNIDSHICGALAQSFKHQGEDLQVYYPFDF